MCCLRLETLTTPSLEQFTLCKQELNCYIENPFNPIPPGGGGGGGGAESAPANFNFRELP